MKLVQRLYLPINKLKLLLHTAIILQRADDRPRQRRVLPIRSGRRRRLEMGQQPRRAAAAAAEAPTEMQEVSGLVSNDQTTRSGIPFASRC